MADEGSQGTGTAAGGNDNANGGPGAELDAQLRQASGKAAPRPAAPPDGSQAATGTPSAAQAASGKSPEELLADAAADGDGDGKEDPLAKANAEIARWKTQARENEKRAKLNADKAKNFDAYEDSQKTELERVASQLAAAQAEAKDAREDKLRLLAAANYDLPPSLIPHLGGGTEDEITERAEAFAAAINERAAVLAAAQAQAAAQTQQAPARNGNGLPVESLRPGALPASDNKPGDPNAWFRGMLASSKNR